MDEKCSSMNAFQDDRYCVEVYGDQKSFISATFESRPCGFPPFCKASAYDSCANITLFHCKSCNMGKAAAFLSFVVCLGIVILFGNILIVAVGYRRYKNRSLQKFDIFRTSLAAADALTGVLILVITTHNFDWTIRSTATELNIKQIKLQGTAVASFGGWFYLFMFTSSLYHLLFIGLQRLYAIARPILYKLQGKRTVLYGLGIVWVFAALTASIPAWFPQRFTFSYYVTTLLFWPSVTMTKNKEYLSSSLALMAIFVVLPFILMTSVSIALGVMLRAQTNKSRKLSSHGQPNSPNCVGQERLVFKNVAIMQIGFTLTLVPVMAVVLCFYTGRLNCSNVTIPYVVGFYLTMCNSLVNVIVYSARDSSFRSCLGEMISSWNPASSCRKKYIIT
ncbi:unnamed protein product [Clavelina lepadiformis]|uniref:G-protein coupled receptors family 1 profile domain-containing protein n=1 Tax=Clavelina lepadiformis TaxID=159417 RepID=A0ABP0FAX4_CLALP